MNRQSVVLAVMIFILILFSGCATTTPSTNYPTYKCKSHLIFTAEEFNCCVRKSWIDGDIAREIAELYASFAGFSLYKTIGPTPNPKMAWQWNLKAAELGNCKALNTVFSGYHLGNPVTQNERLANKYLDKAVDSCQWAMLVKANRVKNTDPETAFELYREAAIYGNCHAQYQLALSYRKGILTSPNRTMAYFWALVAGAGEISRTSETHALAHAGSIFGSCSPYSIEKVMISRGLSPKLKTLAQEAASNWSPGMEPPELGAPKTPEVKPTEFQREIATKAASIQRRSSLQPATWKPVPLNFQYARHKILNGKELFKRVRPFVWTVFAASSKKNLAAFKGISTGSAVAVGHKLLLTNYHVIHQKPYILIIQGKRILPVEILGIDKNSDKCALRIIGPNVLPYVKSVRSKRTLAPGDTSYTVGSPQGLEASLSVGIVSGLRRIRGISYVQTTAPVSPGSSGGGLFDHYGNLIGITTFRLRNGEALNFAIAIDEFGD